MNVPDELCRSTPRDVMLTAGGRTLAAIACVMVVAAFVTGAWLYGKALEGRDAERASEVTAGRIVGLAATRGDHPRWVATYTYDVPPARYRAVARLGRTDREQVAVGDRIQVRYVSAKPQRSWIEGRAPGDIGQWVGPLVGSILAAIGVLLLLLLRRHTHLLAYGRGAIAFVTGSKRSGQHGRKTVAVEFDALSGARRRGSFESDKPPAIGSSVVIVYDPDRPSRTARYPMPLVRCIKRQAL